MEQGAPVVIEDRSRYSWAASSPHPPDPQGSSMPTSILFTQCLQHDFVAPVGAHEPLPNKLHVGREEATRLLGYQPSRGSLAQPRFSYVLQPDGVRGVPVETNTRSRYAVGTEPRMER